MDRVRQLIQEVERVVEVRQSELERERDRFRTVKRQLPQLALPEAEQAVRRVSDEIPVERRRTPARGVGWSARRALESRNGLRQAIVMAEIIGPPKALRGPEIGQ